MRLSGYLEAMDFVRFYFLGKTHRNWLNEALRADSIENVQAKAIEIAEDNEDRRKDRLLDEAATYFIDNNIKKKTQKISQQRVFWKFKLMREGFTREDLRDRVDELQAYAIGEDGCGNRLSDDEI